MSSVVVHPSGEPLRSLAGRAARVPALSRGIPHRLPRAPLPSPVPALPSYRHRPRRCEPAASRGTRRAWYLIEHAARPLAASKPIIDLLRAPAHGSYAEPDWPRECPRVQQSIDRCLAQTGQQPDFVQPEYSRFHFASPSSRTLLASSATSRRRYRADRDPSRVRLSGECHPNRRSPGRQTLGDAAVPVAPSRCRAPN